MELDNSNNNSGTETSPAEGEGGDNPINVEAQSKSLTEAEVQAILSEDDGVEENTILPSDEVEFNMPEKLQGKTAEEIAEMYINLEKMKNKQIEGEGGDLKEEGNPEQESNPTQFNNNLNLSDENYEKYSELYNSKDGLSEAEYAELAELGVSKQKIQEEAEFQKYKAEKALTKVLEPIGGLEKFKEASAWAKDNIDEGELATFNQDLASSTPNAQRLLLKELYGKMETATTNVENIHTNQSQYNSNNNKGYANQGELLQDMANPLYGNDKYYTKAVEAKLAKSNF